MYATYTRPTGCTYTKQYIFANSEVRSEHSSRVIIPRRNAVARRARGGVGADRCIGVRRDGISMIAVLRAFPECGRSPEDGKHWM